MSFPPHLREHVHFPGVLSGALPIVDQDERRVMRKLDLGNGGCLLVITPRKRGVSLGDHYHTGENLWRMPERLVVLSGTWRIEVAKVVDGAIGAVGTEVVNEAREHRFPPFTWHRLTLLSSEGALLEFCAIEHLGQDIHRVTNAPAVAPL